MYHSACSKVQFLTVIFIALVLAACSTSSNKADNTMAQPVVDDTLISTDTLQAIDSTQKAVDSVSATAPKTDTPKTQTALTLIVDKLTSDTAPVVVGVFSPKNKFPDPADQLKQYKFKPHGKKLIARLNNLPYGTYALALYQDANSNGKIDKNILGIPTEAYAFSNNYKPTVRAPVFDDCRFNHHSAGDTVVLSLIKF